MIASHHKVSLNIDVTPESAWEILGGVSGVDSWLAPISACRVEGSKRYCTAEGKEFSEDILSVDHEHKVLRYAIPEQHLLPVQEIIGEMNVRKTGTGTAIVDWEWEFQVEPANVRYDRKNGLSRDRGLDKKLKTTCGLRPNRSSH